MPSLLDTNVVSELQKSRPDANVLAYLASQALDQLFISAVTMAEIQYGILNAQTDDRKRQLERWLQDDVRIVFQARTLPITEGILVRWRVLMEQGRRSGRTFSQPDLLIAATALEHNMTLVTRNTRDFMNIPDLMHFDPWGHQP